MKQVKNEDVFKPKKPNWAVVLPRYWDGVKDKIYTLSKYQEDYLDDVCSVGEEEADPGIPYEQQVLSVLEYADFFALFNENDLKNLKREYTEYKKYSANSLYDIDSLVMVDPYEVDKYDDDFMLANVSEYVDLDDYPALDTLYSFYKRGFQDFSFADENEREYENNFDGFVKGFISEQNEKFDYLEKQKEIKKTPVVSKQDVVMKQVANRIKE